MAAVAAASRRHCAKDSRGSGSQTGPPASVGLWFSAPGQANYSLLPTRDAEETDEQPPAPEPDRQRRRSLTGTRNDGAPQDCWTRFHEKGMVFLERIEVQMLSALIIVLNALVIGLETDYPKWPGWEFVENSFLIFFTTELVVRIVIITPKKYFAWTHNSELIWNIFDLGIVSLGLIDFTATVIAPDAGGMGFATVFRIIRLARILRIFRIIRFLKQLYLLAYGFVEAALAIFWVTILMSFVLYVCGIMLARVYGHVPEEDPDHEFLSSHFGSVPGSMLTLFELMSSPDLASYSEVLNNRPSMLPFLIGFIIFGSFGMIALLTGVISESMFEKNKAKMEEERLEREQKRTRFQRECGELFDSVDADGSGAITNEELRGHAHLVADFLERYGMSVSDAELSLMYDALDCDASGSVDRSELVNGVMQMCEDIRPITIMELHNSIHKCQKRVEESNKHIGSMGSKFEAIDSRMDCLSKTVGLIYAATVESRDRAAAREPPPESAAQGREAGQPEAASARAPEVSRPEAPGSPEAAAQPTDAGASAAAPQLPPPPQSCQEAAEAAASDAQPAAPGCCAAGGGGQPAALVPAPAATAQVAKSEDKAQTPRSRDREQPLLEGEGHSADFPFVRTPTFAVLEDFRSRLEELARQFQVEVKQAEAASCRMGELLSLQAEHTARLNGYSSALKEACAMAPRESSEKAEAAGVPAVDGATGEELPQDVTTQAHAAEVHNATALGVTGEQPPLEASAEAAVEAPKAAAEEPGL